ncbi:Bug family tripartite tricarboxylate transporter substrate binding protein [Variovorax terrae]|uniref:Tripartite tricarboxylate transporter substrate binding protein n=1 Tax=Variovorax terrae TaxID=2923278 RepID=A0A9X2APE4_9BURK|nr:tripartite tricarboxylate transporter substrate-binding protein [Variovorax terrae]MCJ0764795.1 tripartite tricarboxylate transporter substrate binding protein [Variovorax terrae]
MLRSFFLKACLAAWAAAAAHGAAAQPPYPSKPIRIVTPIAPGGYEWIARLLAPKLTASLGQPIVIENRVGANGNIAMDLVAKAPADGYTLLFASTGALTINTSIYERMPLDPMKDLEPVALAGTTAMLWVAHPGGPIRTLGDFVQQAQAAPGKLDLAMGASGSLNHLVFEGLRQRHRLDVTVVPHKTAPEAQLAVISGLMPIMVDAVSTGTAQVRSGKLLPLAVTSAARVDTLPNVPTVKELGLDDREYLGWYAFMAPRGTPPQVIAQLNQAINAALKAPDVQERMRSTGTEPTQRTPEELRRFMVEEQKKWGGIAKAGHVKVQ